jgi:hypothetical protein
MLLQSSGRKQSRDRGKVKAEVHRVQKQLGNVKVRTSLEWLALLALLVQKYEC